MSSSVPLVEAAEPLLFSSDATATAEAAAGSPKYANKSSTFHGTLNFTNCVLGAGIIGTGGAIANSGYAVSVVTLLFCALLTKLSLDMVIEMGDSRNATFEELGELAFGSRSEECEGRSDNTRTISHACLRPAYTSCCFSLVAGARQPWAEPSSCTASAAASRTLS